MADGYVKERTMKKTVTAIVAALALLVLPVEAELTKARPEEVGLSSERLQRIQDAMRRHIEAGDFSGAVTLVARKGRLAHLEAHGFMDLETKTPMPGNAVFRIAS